LKHLTKAFVPLALTLLLTAPLALLAPACTSTPTTSRDRAASATLTPPVAPRDPSIRDVHGERFVDDYAWLRNREDPRTIPYIEAENTYSKAMLAPLDPLAERLYDEMLSRLKEDDSTAPARRGEYWYYTRTEKGKAYRIYCRRRGSPTAPEEVYLDANQLAQGLDYFSLGVVDVSEDHRVLAFSTDELGNERYALRFKDLSTGQLFPDVVEDTSDDSAWANDHRTFFYTKVDTTTRPYQLWRHTLGTPSSSDVLVYEEKDERFRLGVSRSRHGRFILMNLSSNSNDEWWVIDADAPDAPPRVIAPRRPKVEYSVDVGPDRFFIRANDEHVNFRLVQAPIDDPSPANWLTVIGGRDGVTIEDIDAFANHLVISERENGLQQIRVRRYSDASDHTVSFPEAAYTTYVGDNDVFRTQTLRLMYTSPVTPPQVIDYEMESRQRTIVKKQEVPNYDAEKYVVERLMAPAPDGKLVPITLLRRRDMPRDGTGAGLMEGYGSYGVSNDPWFDSFAISLVDRGMFYAVAHVRGGADLGRGWYEDGRLRNKMNTFTDFIACAEFLMREKYVASDRLAITGGSAGGLLMGAVVNMRPDLFRAVVAFVPFVDVMNTMLDPTIPLTVTEWEQWGDPRNAEDYAYMRAYSPYDNVQAKAYPAMMVRTGLNDPRVAYWEPAKWVARLRALKTDDNPLLLVTHMGAGHGGASGRYERMREWAATYAFVLDQVGLSGR
jgi:oligopeptidase B